MTPTIDKLYLELSKITTAKTERELELEDLLTSARCIAERRGEDTAWQTFSARLAEFGIGSVTPKPFKLPPGEVEDYPSAFPIPDHEGFVKSPYVPGGGNVDVRGFCRGQKMRCPFTGKIFLIP